MTTSIELKISVHDEQLIAAEKAAAAMEVMMTPPSGIPDMVNIHGIDCTIMYDGKFTNRLHLRHLSREEAVTILSHSWCEAVKFGRLPRDMRRPYQKKKRNMLTDAVAYIRKQLPDKSKIIAPFYTGGVIRAIVWDGYDALAYTEPNGGTGEAVILKIPGTIPILSEMCHGCKRYAPFQCKGYGDALGDLDEVPRRCAFLYCSQMCQRLHLDRHDSACYW